MSSRSAPDPGDVPVKPLRVAVFADAGHVQRFGLDVIDAVEGCDQISVFSCTNTVTKKRPVKHGAYYALNLLAIRSTLTASVPIARSSKRIAETVEFETPYEGAWQRLPPEIVDRLRGGGFDVILKFGMGLLRVPPPEELPVPILSYHHGDPDHFRGRPAGFWEIRQGQPVIGQIVQVIGNKLDAGGVVAFAETKVQPHSYKATLAEAYRHSPLLINQAIRNAIAGVTLDKPSKGKNYRLPSNFQVAGFAATMAGRTLRRLAYGAVFEKKWHVSTAPVASIAALIEGGAFPPESRWTTPKVAPGFSFYADPFFSASPDGLLVEALNARTGLGEIVFVGADGEQAKVSDQAGHLSYPATITLDGRDYVVPESASFSAPQVCELEGGKLVPQFPLDIEGATHVLDPTLIEQGGRLYLFGNIKTVGSNTLWLWSADRIDGRFTVHPASPIRMTPEGSRMGGNLLRLGDRLIRFGQDFRSSYGDGLIAFEVEELTPATYRERAIGRIALTDRKGPHTLNFRDGEILFDWYRDRFAPGAGVRRFAAKLAKRRRAAQ